MSDKKENGKSLAAEIYKNTKMGADSITDLIGHVENEKLRVEMTSELDRYEELASRAAKLSRDRGEEPKEEGALAKAAVKMSMAVNTMADSSASHIAEMMIQGTNMGIIDINKALNGTKNLSPQAAKQAKEMLSREQQYIDSLKRFL